MYLEQEDSFTSQVCRGCKFDFQIKSFEAWKEESLDLFTLKQKKKKKI